MKYYMKYYKYKLFLKKTLFNTLFNTLIRMWYIKLLRVVSIKYIKIKKKKNFKIIRSVSFVEKWLEEINIWKWKFLRTSLYLNSQIFRIILAQFFKILFYMMTYK